VYLDVSPPLDHDELAVLRYALEGAGLALHPGALPASAASSWWRAGVEEALEIDAADGREPGGRSLGRRRSPAPGLGALAAEDAGRDPRVVEP
jgi:hypothetical protein